MISLGLIHANSNTGLLFILKNSNQPNANRWFLKIAGKKFKLT